MPRADTEELVERVLRDAAAAAGSEDTVLSMQQHKTLLRAEFGQHRWVRDLQAWCLSAGYQYLPRQYMHAVVRNGSAARRNAIYFDPDDGWTGFRFGRSGSLSKYDEGGDAMADRVLLVRYGGTAPRFCWMRVGRWAWLLKLRPIERFRRDYAHYCPSA